MSDKLALLIGINYFNTAHELNGCINDTKNIKHYLINKLGYLNENITILTDDNPNENLTPTKNNIINSFNQIINNIKNNNKKELFILYSGHGSNIYDTSNDERDGMDEIIIPSDYSKGNIIKDDQLNQLINKIPNTCKVFSLFDCCNSGTILDLRYLLETKTVKRIENKNYSINNNQNVYLISGCKDDQTSADFFNRNTNEFAGALTTSFLETNKKLNYNNISFYNLIYNMHKYLRNNNFTQTPQISFNKNINKYTFYRKNNVLLHQDKTPTKPQKPNKQRFRNRQQYLRYLRYLYYLRYLRYMRSRRNRRNRKNIHIKKTYYL